MKFTNKEKGPQGNGSFRYMVTVAHIKVLQVIQPSLQTIVMHILAATLISMACLEAVAPCKPQSHALATLICIMIIHCSSHFSTVAPALEKTLYQQFQLLASVAYPVTPILTKCAVAGL